MDEFDRITADPLWPGFEAKQIPVEIYDGRQTWLFRHPHPPETFVESPQHEGVFVVVGQHPSVRANTSVELGGVQTATVILEPSRKPLRELAALIAHECFHVYQREHHPKWIANEAHLFAYPLDNAGALQRRLMETESLRRALLEHEPRGTACWIAEALRMRDQRFAALPPNAVAYERAAELNEGLANYIQVRAAGREASFALPQGDFAVDAVRDRSYQIGTALALLLDRVAPGWQAGFSAGSLDELLKSKTYFAAAPCSFTDTEEASLLARAGSAVSALKERRSRLKADFLAAKGYRFEVVTDPQHPLVAEGFDPSNATAVGGGGILHRRYVKLGNDDGTVEITARPALTQDAGSQPLADGVRQIIVTGLAQAPSIQSSGGTVQISAEGLQANFRHATVRKVGHKTTVEIGEGVTTPEAAH
jgi:hypothetical protein